MLALLGGLYKAVVSNLALVHNWRLSELSAGLYVALVVCLLVFVSVNV